MDRDRLKHITTSHYRKIKTYMAKISSDLNEESLHRFRVEYKKLRAFLRMQSEPAITANKIKIAKDLKKAYTIAGSIRDLQLQELRILEATTQEPKKPVPYINLLHREIAELQPELAEIITERPVALSK